VRIFFFFVRDQTTPLPRRIGIHLPLSSLALGEFIFLPPIRKAPLFCEQPLGEFFFFRGADVSGPSARTYIGSPSALPYLGIIVDLFLEVDCNQCDPLFFFPCRLEIFSPSRSLGTVEHRDLRPCGVPIPSRSMPNSSPFSPLDSRFFSCGIEELISFGEARNHRGFVPVLLLPPPLLSPPVMRNFILFFRPEFREENFLSQQPERRSWGIAYPTLEWAVRTLFLFLF